MEKQLIQLVLIFFKIFCIVQASPSRVPCQLQWIPAQNGASPEDNVIAFSSDEIVARINISGLQIPSRLSPENGQAYASSPSDGTLHSSTTYEVLTNPLGCVVDWAESADLVENLAVTSSHFQIGRAHLIDEDGNFNNVGGAVIHGEGLFTSFQGEQQISSEYQVLTSVHPLLNGHLYNFTLNMNGIRSNHFELIESETIINSGVDDVTHEINHSGAIEEIFSLGELGFTWSGIYKLTITNFFGNANSLNFEIQDHENFQLATIQNRSLTFRKTISIKENEQKAILICSAAQIFNGEIDFEATGRFHGDEMTAEQVKLALQDSGRTALHTNGAGVITTIRGKVSGKFYLGKQTTVTHATDENQTCHEMLSKSV